MSLTDVEKIVQLRIVDGRLVREKTKVLNIAEDDIWGEDVVLTPIIVPNESKAKEVYEEVFDLLGEEGNLSGCVKTWDEMYEAKFDGNEFMLEDFREYDFEVYEFGRTLRYRWVFSPNLEEVFKFLSSFKPDDGPYVYLSSEMIVKGVVFPGGSFFYDESGGVSASDGLKDLDDVLRRIFQIFVEEKGKGEAVVAVSGGEKSKLLLELLPLYFSSIRAYSFWEKDGCEVAKGFGIPCEVVKDIPRSAGMIQAFLQIEVKDRAVAVWGADRDFLKRHMIDFPEIFTPFWFLEREDLKKRFGFQEISVDDVLQEVF